MQKLKTILLYFALFTGFLAYVMAFEPFDIAEFGYVFAVPMFLVARFGNLSGKAWNITALLFAWIAWIAILVWLRHVYPPAGVFFLLALSFIIALFFFAWLFAMRHVARLPSFTIRRRLFGIVFLSSFWVFLEWVRSFIFTGFPWMLLAHSQWRRPTVIQSAEFGGPYIVSFILIFFNLALAEFISKLWRKHKRRLASYGDRELPKRLDSPAIELYMAIAFLFLNFWLYIGDFGDMKNSKKGFRVGMVQPDFAGIMRWDPELEKANFETIRDLTLGLKKARVDLTLWPESSTPPRWPVLGTPSVKTWVEEVCSMSGKPIIMGNGAMIIENGECKIFNAAFLVSPQSGLNENFYAKQKLVPFGEYLPSWCFFLNKTVVPVGSMQKGESPVILDAEIAGSPYKIGPVICYEDIFPAIGRASAAAGADMLFVCTNDSWYGREGGAWQHAAHSAFQAVSTRRPVLRSSINGLSGVFDQYGRLIPVFTLLDENGNVFDGTGNAAVVLDILDETGKPMLAAETLMRKTGGPLENVKGSIYFRGAGYADLVFYEKFDSFQTFYVRYGDWFPKLCGIFLILAILLRKKCLTSASEK